MREELAKEVQRIVSSAYKSAGESDFQVCCFPEKYIDGYCKDRECSECKTAHILAAIQPFIAQQVAEAFNKGVRHGTTIRNINWNVENHKRHGDKMRRAHAADIKAVRELVEKVENPYLTRRTEDKRYMDGPIYHAIEKFRHAILAQLPPEQEGK